VEILRVHLQRRQLPLDELQLPALAAAANGFSGAELEQVIVSALYTAHGDQRMLDTELLMDEIRNTRPLSVLMAEQVGALREWARERTVPAD
jgi:ATP-dependent Zn protease